MMIHFKNTFITDRTVVTSIRLKTNIFINTLYALHDLQYLGFPKNPLLFLVST